MEILFEKVFEEVLFKLKNLGINVVLIEDVTISFYGDMDGCNIYLPQSPAPEIRLFTLIHLAAHTYQWTLSQRYVEIGSQLFFKPEKQLFDELMAYEEDAARLSISLLHKLDLEFLVLWFTRYSRCDLAYLQHYYTTGEQKPLKEFYREDVLFFEEMNLPVVESFRQYVIINKGLVIY